ncbi:oxo-acid lyase [Paenibacillus frigoriresistens]|uniref:KDGP aldolase n=1 Tax=Paenibacillus alginolyticus TaxID=59839 RepID=UPI001564499C|nr:KDGP aldolase [Paenibacillus frigoriresistens]NRF95855.1 oxo-acid lyase [Paenibacillus frigoriresistens]
MNQPIIKLNVLAKNVDNAKHIVEAAKGNVYVGLMVKKFASVDAAVETVLEFQEQQVPVSVGLGAGDPAMWSKVVDISLHTKPAHVNQVFPAAGYTLGALRAVGSDHTIVNALITPSGTPGQVLITTGPLSSQFKETVSCDAAAAMLEELGVHSVKFYPIGGTDRLDEVAAMVKAAVKRQIKIFEPTGGIDVQTIGKVIEVCAEHGAEQIIPHVYTSIIDSSTGLTRIEDVRELAKFC